MNSKIKSGWVKEMMADCILSLNTKATMTGASAPADTDGDMDTADAKDYGHGLL